MSVSLEIAVPSFEGVINFRDFGGCPGADGRRVARGRLFRSGHLGEATPDDVAALAALDLALVVDLRRIAERTRLPSRWPRPPGAVLIEHRGSEENIAAPHLAYLAEPGLDEAAVVERMAGAYRAYPFKPSYVAIFRAWFQALAATRGKALVNCHAGKDRTGMLVALTLHALGASEEAILQDYMATNLHNRLDERMPALAAQFLRDNGQPVVEPLLRRMMGVEPGYLAATFEAIRAQHGTVDAYLAEALGVDEALRRILRDRYLEM